MTLTQRTILIIVSTFIVLLFFLAITSDLILLSSYSRLEKEDITSHTRHISNHIEDQLNQLSMSAQEVAEQMKENSRLAATYGLTSKRLFTEHFMRSHSIDIAAVYDNAGRLVSISCFDCEKNKPCPVPIERQHALTTLVSRINSSESATSQGVVNLAGSPLLVALTPVIDSRGVKLGVEVIGWFIDRVELERIFRASGALISLHDLKGSLLPDVEKAAKHIAGGADIAADVVDSAYVAGYFALKDIFGQPSFIVRVAGKRILYEQGKATITYIISALFLSGGVLCCVMLIFVRRTILTRLHSLTSKVRWIAGMRDISARVPLSRHRDELATLALSINSMLDSLEKAETELRESEERYRQLSDELNRKAIDLAAANNELETFNYSVSHDMRGPLTKISGYCQLLLDDESDLDPDAKEYITRIYESEAWLNEMIDALLLLAQLTRIDVVSCDVNLSAIAEEALKELSLECPYRTVKTRIEPDIVVAGDSRLLKMVMINLLNNAWKYSSGKSEAQIEFGVDRTASGPVYYVRDNGDGFDMKDADGLFHVFTRLHDSSQFAGTGVGLATVQRIIFRHGGRIWAEAQPRIGATFFFTLQ